MQSKHNVCIATRSVCLTALIDTCDPVNTRGMSHLKGQAEFESKDCHPQMKSRMISIILLDNEFYRNVNLECCADRLNRS